VDDGQGGNGISKGAATTGNAARNPVLYQQLTLANEPRGVWQQVACARCQIGLRCTADCDAPFEMDFRSECWRGKISSGPKELAALLRCIESMDQTWY
jgi:hypothetical protein